MKALIWAVLILAGLAVLVPAVVTLAIGSGLLALFVMVAAVWAIVLRAEHWIAGEHYSYPQAFADSFQQIVYTVRQALAR